MKEVNTYTITVPSQSVVGNIVNDRKKNNYLYLHEIDVEIFGKIKNRFGYNLLEMFYGSMLGQVMVCK